MVNFSRFAWSIWSGLPGQFQPVFTLNEGEEGLLRIQYATMEAYHSVLQQRLKLIEKALRDSNIGEGKTLAELYLEYKNGEREL